MSSHSPSVVDIGELLAMLRVRVFRRMLRLNAMPLSTVKKMMTWPHSGFALDCGTRIEAGDRAALIPPARKHVVRYCAR